MVTRPKHCARVTARDCAARCTNTDKQGSLSTRSTSDRTWFVSCASRRIIGPVANATGPCIRHESPRGVSFTEPSCKRDGFLDLAPSSFLRVVLLYHMPSSLSLLHSSCASCRVTGPAANATGLCIRHESPRGVSFTEPSCKRDGFLDAAPSSFTLNGQNPTPPPARFCAQPSTSNTPRKLELAYVCARRWCLTKDQVDSRNHEGRLPHPSMPDFVQKAQHVYHPRKLVLSCFCA